LSQSCETEQQVEDHTDDAVLTDSTMDFVPLAHLQSSDSINDILSETDGSVDKVNSSLVLTPEQKST